MNLPEFYLQTLGANSAVPTVDRFPSSFILGYKDKMCLIDCGEGAQVKMSEFRVKRDKIDHIYISHLHGDHIYGLPGLLNSFALNNRQSPLRITGPKGIKHYLDVVLSTSQSHLSFDITYCELEGEKSVTLESAHTLQVHAFPLTHRIPTYAYKFTEVIEGRNIDPAAIAKYTLTIPEILLAKKGINIQREGRTLHVEDVTLAPRKPRSFAYCSDTIYNPAIVSHISNVDLLYHEATYLHDRQEKALKYMHSTAREAAQIAKQAEVGKLLIGHYSSRYHDLSPLEQEAREVFENAHLALQGEVHEIG